LNLRERGSETRQIGFGERRKQLHEHEMGDALDFTAAGRS
jgi:hypothetical protein